MKVNYEGGQVLTDVMPGLKKTRFSFTAVLFFIFCSVSGGAFGIESIIPSSGPGMTLMLLIIIPLMWALPMGLYVSELTNLAPVDSGPYVWVKMAFGEFWGFNMGYWMAIANYLIDYPDNEYAAQCHAMIDRLEERLDRKEYESAKLYYTIEDYKAAHYALKLVLKEDADNVYREDIMYYTVMSAYKYALNSVVDKQRDRYVTFTDDYFTFVSEFPDSKYRKELDGLASKVQKILNKQ